MQSAGPARGRRLLCCPDMYGRQIYRIQVSACVPSVCGQGRAGRHIESDGGSYMKMSRRELRRDIFLMLFRIEFNTREELQEQMEMFLEEKADISEADSRYIRDKVNAVLDVQEEIDSTIMRICTGWRLERLGKAELAILRLAVYEMVKDEDIPKGVAINEALELAKVYCSEDAPRFINGVLAKLA